MLNERDFRKSNWVEGVWLTFADGSEWSVPMPNVRAKVDVTDDQGRFCMLPDFSDEPELGKLNKRSLESAKACDETTMFTAWFEIAMNLLARNYALGEEEWRQLLVIRPDCDESFKRWMRLMDVATGGCVLDFNTDAVISMCKKHTGQ